MKQLNLITALLVTLFAVSISAQTVIMQGVLRDPLGRTVNDAPYSLTFKVYDVATGGEALWTETQVSVDVKHGVFSVELGSVTTMSTLTFSTQYFVAVSVEGGPELEPRIKLASVPTSLGVLGVNNVFPSSGNVGVGTADPQALFHIEQTGNQDLLIIDNGASILKVTSNGDLYVPNSINFTDGSILSTAQGGTASALSSAGNTVIASDNDSSGTGDIQFKTGVNSRMIIKNSGNVGISTDTPLHALHVNDNVEDIAMFENTDGSAAINIKSGSDNYTGVKFFKGDDEKWWIGSDGNDDFYIYDYTDGSAKMKFWQDDDVSIYGDQINLNANTRVTGTKTFEVGGNTDLSGTLDVNALININATAGNSAALKFLDGSTQKWWLGKDTGNHFSIHNYATDTDALVLWSGGTVSLNGSPVNLNGPTTVYGTLYTTGTLGVTGNTDLDGTLDVAGNTDIAGILNVASSSGNSFINLSASSGDYVGLRFNEAGANKWEIFKDLSNNFVIHDYTAGVNRMIFWTDDITMNFAGGRSIIFGKIGSAGEPSIYPSSDNWGYVGTSTRRYFQAHFNQLYYNDYYDLPDRSIIQNIKSLVENRSNSTNLDKVLALNPVKYDFNLDTHPFYKDTELKEGDLENSKDRLGFIAQELMEVIPEMVVFSKDYQLYSVQSYHQMLPVLVGAMQEMKAENDDLKSRIERLEEIINE